MRKARSFSSDATIAISSYAGSASTSRISKPASSSCSGVGGIGRGPSRRAGPTAGTNDRPDQASGCGGVAKGQDTTVEPDGESSFVKLYEHSMVQIGLADMLCANFSRCILNRTVIEAGTLRELAQAIDALGASSTIQNVDEQPLNEHRLPLI